MTASHLILLQCLFGAALTDLFDRRIPNILIGTYLLFGTFLNFRCIAFMEEYHFIPPFIPLAFLISFFLTVLVLSILTVMTNAGAGDAKLLALILSWTGFYNGLSILFPGLLLALAFIMISKAETAAVNLTHKCIYTPMYCFMPLHYTTHKYISPNIFDFIYRIPLFQWISGLFATPGSMVSKHITIPLAVPVFLGAIPGLILGLP